MARKNNIRSIRFSDELAELINRQIGNNFSERFNNLITKCVWELPQKEAEIQRLDEEIKRKAQKLHEANLRYTKMLNQTHKLESLMRSLEYEISESILEWQNIKT